MNHDGVKIAVGDFHGSLVVLLLVRLFSNQNISQAATDKRAEGPRISRRLKQRQQLTCELFSPEGKQLDEYHLRIKPLISLQDDSSAQALCALDRATPVAANELTIWRKPQ